MRVPHNPFRYHRQSPLFTAAVIARRFGGTGEANPAGWYSARCPCHADHRASLSLRDAQFGVIVKCFAGCPPVEIKAAIYAATKEPLPPRPSPPKVPKVDLAAIAARIWGEARPPCGTLVETYLHARGITLPIPSSLRFHPHLFHLESRTFGPAMVGLVEDVAGAAVGLHRTWLASNGRDKAALDPVRKALCSTSGHAVRLGSVGDSVLLAEGVESALSAMELLGVSAGWATLSAPGLTSVRLPDEVRTVVAAADNDATGIAAAESLQHRLRHEGRQMVIIVPHPAKDFNDLLRAVRA